MAKPQISLFIPSSYNVIQHSIISCQRILCKISRELTYFDENRAFSLHAVLQSDDRAKSNKK